MGLYKEHEWSNGGSFRGGAMKSPIPEMRGSEFLRRSRGIAVLTGYTVRRPLPCIKKMRRLRGLHCIICLYQKEPLFI